MFFKYLPWWAWILIIVVIGLIIAFIPRARRKTHKKVKSVEKQETSNLTDNLSNVNKIKQENRSLQDKRQKVLPFFLTSDIKPQLRWKTLVYVEQKKDSCPLCRPFENKVISLELSDDKLPTMIEAISKGYHHVGCTHIDIDYYPNKTVIPPDEFTVEFQSEQYELKKQQFYLEKKLRELKYLATSNPINDLDQQIKVVNRELDEFVNKNNLQRNSIREDILCSFIKKWS